MASILDSEAHFLQRCEDLGLSVATRRAIKNLGLATVGRYAYSVSQPGQAIPEDQFASWLATSVGSVGVGESASLKRLLFECQTLVLSDLRLQVSDPGAHESKPLASAERERRLKSLRTALPGAIIEGDGEPSRALLELAVQMHTLNEIKYIAPEKATSRIFELTSEKPASRMLELTQDKLVVKDREPEDGSACTTPMLLAAAMRRRSLALHFADVMSFEIHERYVARLFSHLTHAVPDGFGRPTLAQVLQADRLAWVHLIEKNVKPRSVGGVRPLDTALPAAFEVYTVAFALIPRPSSGSGGQGQGRAKKKRKQKTKKTESADGKADATKRTPPPPPAKGTGKGKGGAEGQVPNDIRALGGKARTPQGKDICFGFNSAAGCRLTSCSRLHVCARCFDRHPISHHKE